ncbi:uncharacterized protein Z519_10689 [Cladophialophora bantiana CBS 173.52]|uniref:Zn(2)-C6 fungal-type domain-containing protein n=1 Tax=Cladophialophora bantiana (strain ATCC 10958 / CBS 173.52 / CDC B-1940 / NIH 8579) TaxID=1442370 RepID=A0A0D2H5R2_CLAB1|nr:uncharacterized protein Z519_10689 [Cladophialophora bantiana CBS 173.52]KIW88643.1 hypothetical protein Z519_10689 [Cladophialophora bantiana CBS 173.52]
MAPDGQGRHGPKTRTGCLTCKRRRVKCGLERPSCTRCVKAGRTCEGYQLSLVQEDLALPSKATTPPRLSNSSSLLSAFRATQSEWQAYRFYSHRVASILGGAFDTELWQKQMLQVADTEPTVRNGIFAIGNLFRHGHNGASDHASNCICAHCRQALRYYNKSILAFSHSLQEPRTSQAAQVALLSCIIFICLEFYRMNDSTGISLISRGCSMVAEAMQNQPASETTSINPKLLKVFDRLWLLSSMFGYHLPKPSPKRSLLSPSARVPDFNCIEGARDSLHEILELVQDLRLRVYQAHSNSSSPKDLSTATASLQREQQIALFLLETWQRNLDIVVAQPAMRSSQQSLARLMLRVHYLITKIRASASLDPSEISHKDHLDDFNEIVLVAEEGLTGFPLKDEAASFSFEMSFLAPLYLTVLKCREPTIRRKALELMRLTGAKEGLWHRSEGLCIAARVMELEEGIAAFDLAENPPETANRWPTLFYDVLAGLNYRKAGKTYVDVVYLTYDPTNLQRFRSRQETLVVEE